MRIAGERYWLLRTHEWSDEVLRQVIEGKGRWRHPERWARRSDSSASLARAMPSGPRSSDLSSQAAGAGTRRGWPPNSVGSS